MSAQAHRPHAPRGGVAACLFFAVAAYRIVLSPLLGGRCRFVPSCSVYAQQALDHHGALRGVVLTLQRLARCHPWHTGGADPVPARFSGEAGAAAADGLGPASPREAV